MLTPRRATSPAVGTCNWVSASLSKPCEHANLKAARPPQVAPLLRWFMKALIPPSAGRRPRRSAQLARPRTYNPLPDKALPFTGRLAKHAEGAHRLYI